MVVLRTAEGLTADCTVCKRFYQDGDFHGTSQELIHAMRADNWCTHPVVCEECADRIRVWRNEGQPKDTNPKRRAAEKVAAAATRRRRSVDTIPARPPARATPSRRRRTLL